MAPSPRSAVVPATVLCLIAAALAAPTASSASTSPAVSRPADGSVVTLAPGVTLAHQYMQSDGAPEQVTLLGVDLTQAGIDAASPDGLVGDLRATVKSQVNQRHALAGVNADFFNLDKDAASPRGMLVSSGRLLKSPIGARNANLVIRKVTHGSVASVGSVAFAGEVQRVRKGAPTLRRSITTTNSLVSAKAGGLTLLTSTMAPSSFNRTCTIATGTIARGRWTVASVRSTHSTPAFTSTSWGLLSCQGTGQHWITSNLRRGDTVAVTTSLAGGTPWAAVSGGSVLVRNGRAWRDPLGEHLPYPGQNAETFACVSRNGRHVTLGTIDGYTRESAGVTYHELTTYMLTMSSCWSGVVLDGGGSTTMVAKLPGARKATVQNVPAEQPARPVADTLVVLGG